MSRTLLIGLVVALISLSGLGWFMYARDRQIVNPAPSPLSTNQPSASLQPTTLPSQSPTNTSSSRPSPSASLSQNITITSPLNNANVGRTFTVSGQARVFENVLQIRVTNKRTNTILANQHIMADAKDTGQFGPYTYQVNLTSANLSSGDQLLVEAFQYSAKDGSEIDKKSVNVTFTQ